MSGVFKTHNFPLIAYLMYLNFPIERIERDPQDPKRKVFVFRATPRLVEAVNNFRNKKALVEPEAYWLFLRQAKDRIVENSWNESENYRKNQGFSRGQF